MTTDTTATQPPTPTASPTDSAAPRPAPDLARHRATLDRALDAITTREFWSPHPEHPKAYGEGAAEEGKAAFEALLGTRLDLGQPGTDDWVGGEVSAFGPPLGVEYPHPDPAVLFPAMRAAIPRWRDAGPEIRALVCLEALSRLNGLTPLIAHAVMHTTGQAFPMAFQAGGPHAQDRALEAVAYGYREQTRVPAAPVAWAKPQGRRDPLRLTKRFTPVPRGLALVIGCRTFPTWNGLPGLFASLATGNPVLVKPHPQAVLPLALAVRTLRETLADAGFDPQLVCLAAERPGEGLARELAVHPAIRLVDYTGSTAFGDWLEANARQALVFTEKSGVNTVLAHSTDDYRGMLANLAFSLSLYSGQMCTTPQNLLIPRDGIATDQGPRSFDEVVADLAAAVDGLLADDSRAHALLGAIADPRTVERLEGAAKLGRVALASRALTHPGFPDAVVRTPAVVVVDGPGSATEQVLGAECFGPVSFAVATDSADAAVELLRRTIREHGAMTVGAYTTDPAVRAAVEEVCLEEAAQLSFNLTGGVYVNQTAAFSDFHGTGGNPAANAALCDAAYVAGRFRFVEIRDQA
jgi:phenylacetic acid degradation protein paaN